MLGVENIRPANGGKTRCGKLSDNNIIPPAGTVTDQQLPGRVSAYDDTDMTIIRVKCQVSRLGLGLGDVGAIGMLSAGTPTVTYDIALAVVECPIDEAGTVKPERAVSARRGIASGPYLCKLSPAGVPADGPAFAAPKVVDFPHKLKRSLYGIPAGLIQVGG